MTQGVTADPNYAYQGINPLTGQQCPATPATPATGSTSTPAATFTYTSTPSVTEPGTCPLDAAASGPAGVEQATAEQVSPGEVCTINIAKTYFGITDSTLHTFMAQDNLQSFNALLDEKKGSKMTKAVCQESQNKVDVVHPLCAIEAGVGFRRMYSDNDNKCITASCPPGFISNRGTCDKTPLLKDYQRNKKSYCDERWYDWFTIPNYHLGNNYSNVLQEGDGSNIVRCWNPCAAGQIPEYHVDPVDYESWGDGKNVATKCVSKDEYFYGKYGESDDYCPLAVIHAVTLSPIVANSNLKTKYDAISTSTTTDAFHTLSCNIDADAASISALAKSILPTFVQTPDDRTQRACNGLNDPDKVRYAYTLCSNLNAGDTSILTHLGSSSNQTQGAIIMKQACNAVFSNYGSTALNAIGNAAPITFTDANIQNTSIQAASNNPYDPSYNVTPADVPQFKTVLPNAVKFTIILVISPFVMYLLYILWRYSSKIARIIRRAMRKLGLPRLMYILFYTIYNSFLFGRSGYTMPDYNPYNDMAFAGYEIADAKDTIESLNTKIMFLNIARGEFRT